MGLLSTHACCWPLRAASLRTWCSAEPVPGGGVPKSLCLDPRRIAQGALVRLSCPPPPPPFTRANARSPVRTAVCIIFAAASRGGSQVVSGMRESNQWAIAEKISVGATMLQVRDVRAMCIHCRLNRTFDIAPSPPLRSPPSVSAAGVGRDQGSVGRSQKRTSLS